MPAENHPQLSPASMMVPGQAGWYTSTSAPGHHPQRPDAQPSLSQPPVQGTALLHQAQQEPTQVSSQMSPTAQDRTRRWIQSLSQMQGLSVSTATPLQQALGLQQLLNPPASSLNLHDTPTPVRVTPQPTIPTFNEATDSGRESGASSIYGRIGNAGLGKCPSSGCYLASHSERSTASLRFKAISTGTICTYRNGNCWRGNVLFGTDL